MLVIDSTDANFIALARASLNTLVGGTDNALAYVEERYYPMAGRKVMKVTRGARINDARLNFPLSVGLAERVMMSEHWTRLEQAPSNDASPDKWLKDRAWSNVKSLFIGAQKKDASFMKKVMTTGSSSVIRWTGQPEQTANRSLAGVIRMEQVPAFVTLAHELIHADRIGRGLFAPRRTNSTFVVDERQDATDPLNPVHLRQQPAFQSTTVTPNRLTFTNGRQLANLNGVVTALQRGQVWVDGSMELAEEIATVGLSDDDNSLPLDHLAITENMIRQEHHIQKRLKYGLFNKNVQM